MNHIKNSPSTKLENKLAIHFLTRGKMEILLKHVENRKWKENYIKWG